MLTIRDEEGNLRKMTLEEFAHTQPHHHPVTIDPTEPGRTLYTGITCSNSNYVHTPLIEIAPMADDSELVQSALHINQYDCLLFTSRYAVKYWMEALHKSGQDTSVLSSLQVVSIGATTTESLRQAGVSNVEESKADNSYSLINHFKDLPHQRILIPRSNLGMDLLPGGLRSVGHEVTTVTAYRNVMPEYPQKWISIRYTASYSPPLHHHQLHQAVWHNAGHHAGRDPRPHHTRGLCKGFPHIRYRQIKHTTKMKDSEYTARTKPRATNMPT